MNAVYVYGEISYEHLEALSRAPVGRPVLICSPGGNADLCRAMSNLVRRKRMPTVALGEVASSAALIFAAGPVRVSLADTVFILHRPSIDLSEQLDPSEVQRLSEGFKEFEEWYFNKLEQYGVCSALISKVRSGGDWTLPAWAAMDSGLVDAILQPLDAATEEFHPLSKDLQAVVRAVNIPVDQVHFSYKTEPLQDNEGCGGANCGN